MGLNVNPLNALPKITSKTIIQKSGMFQVHKSVKNGQLKKAASQPNKIIPHCAVNVK